jgi:DNA-binding CsgD family transcriptional regulator/N-acetylneuraminic acid mutarotase
METQNTTEPILSERELEVLKLVAKGATNQQIALDLVISVNTVKVHLRNIFSKLDVESRTEATMYAVREGWITLEGVAAPEEEAAVITPLRIAPWQRLFFAVSALLIALLVFFPPERSVSNSSGRQFTDQTGSAPGSSQGVTTSRWVSRAQMPTARARLAVVAYEGQVYAIGGDTEDGVAGVVEVYDPVMDSWTRRANKPRPVRNIAAAVLGDRIYVPGGYDAMDQAIADLEVYDPLTDSWTEAAPLPSPLFAYAVAVADGKLYLFGGSDGMRYVDTVLIYDPQADSWSDGTPMAEPRGFCAATAVGERIYVVGGYDGQSESALCEIYEPAKEGTEEPPWSRMASMLAGRGGLAVVAVENYLYAIGGGWGQDLSFNARYDPSKDRWTTFDSPLLGEWRTLGAAPITIDTEVFIYVVGGWSGRFLSTNYAYNASFRIFLPSL